MTKRASQRRIEAAILTVLVTVLVPSLGAAEEALVHAEPPDDLDALRALARRVEKGDPTTGLTQVESPALLDKREEEPEDEEPHPHVHAHAHVHPPSKIPAAQEIARLVRRDLKRLGSMSVGRPQMGALVNGQHFGKGKNWRLVAPGNAYGTRETTAYLKRAIAKTFARHPGGHPMYIGDISAPRGGRLKGHLSHQAGRDADLSYFYKGQVSRRDWYRRAHAGNLDVAKSWTFVRALLTETDVKFIFINTSVQKLLKRHALRIGEDPKWIDSVFQYKSKSKWPVIRHSPGHDTHIHVRFYNPEAQEIGRRAYPHLVSRGVVKPRVYYTTYVAKRGDMLNRLASKFRCSVADIQKANKMTGTTLFAGRPYRIPRKGDVRQLGRVRIPARRLPPGPQPAKRGSSGRRAKAAGKK
ncbi:MAG: penicillin-insensitive murein endopeptidase [Myxococcota bacterium]